MPSSSSSAVRGAFSAAYGLFDRLKAELAKFGVIGLAAFVTDFVGYNLLVFGLGTFGVAGASGPLAGRTTTASALSTCAGMVVSWFGNKLWTYKHRPPANPHRAAVLFIVFNVVGLLITAGVLAFSVYVLQLHSLFWDSLFRFLGIGLGTIFRFVTYRRWVFPDSDRPSAIEA